MSAARLDAFLARLMSKNPRVAAFSPTRNETANAGLSEQDFAALANIDFVGLELAANAQP